MVSTYPSEKYWSSSMGRMTSHIWNGSHSKFHGSSHHQPVIINHLLTIIIPYISPMFQSPPTRNLPGPPGLQCCGRLHLEIHRLRAVAEHRHRQGAGDFFRPRRRRRRRVGAGDRGNGGGASGRLRKAWDRGWMVAEWWFNGGFNGG